MKQGVFCCVRRFSMSKKQTLLVIGTDTWDAIRTVGVLNPSDTIWGQFEVFNAAR